MAYTQGMTEAVSALMVQQPFFAVLLSNMLKIERDDSVPTAATNGRYIKYNGPWFDKLSISERMFVLAHEVGHVMFMHFPRGEAWASRGIGPDFQPWSHKRYNKAADYIINDMLTVSGIGSMPHGGLRDSHIATGEDLADEVYLKIPDDDDDNKGQGGQGGQGGHGGFDVHESPDPNDPGLSEQEVKTAVSQAANAARAQGKMPAGLDRIVSEIMEPTKNWKELLRSSFMHELGSDTYTTKRYNKRMMRMFPNHPIILPGLAGYSTSTVVVQIDTSGSIGEKEVATFLGEVAGILTDTSPQCVYVLWVDTEVAGVDVLPQGTPASDLCGLTPKGGGGTDMGAGFTWIYENHLDQEEIVHVVLTDGYTPWPNYEPSWPVIVLSTTDHGGPEWANNIFMGN